MTQLLSSILVSGVVVIFLETSKIDNCQQKVKQYPCVGGKKNVYIFSLKNGVINHNAQSLKERIKKKICPLCPCTMVTTRVRLFVDLRGQVSGDEACENVVGQFSPDFSKPISCKIEGFFKLALSGAWVHTTSIYSSTIDGLDLCGSISLYPIDGSAVFFITG